MQGKSKSLAAGPESVEARVAAFLKAHARRPEPLRIDTRFSARLALQRASSPPQPIEIPSLR